MCFGVFVVSYFLIATFSPEQVHHTFSEARLAKTSMQLHLDTLLCTVVPVSCYFHLNLLADDEKSYTAKRS